MNRRYSLLTHNRQKRGLRIARRCAQGHCGNRLMPMKKQLIPVFAAIFMGAAFMAPAAETSYNDHVLFPISVRDKHGAIDRSGEVVIPPEYDDPIAMREGLARVRKGTRV